jgi:HK97 family phage prohead protease
MSDSILAPPEGEQTERFAFTFAMKAVQEVERDGVPGLLLQGYASRFNERDQQGEVMTRNAFADIAETWGADPEPKVIYYHGMDPALGFRQIGKALDWRVDETGLYVETFVPREPAFKDSSAVKRFKQIYHGIKSGAIRGYSVGGFCTTFGKAIVKWSKSELSICQNPVLATATFALGAKAVKALLGDVPLSYEAGGDVMPAPMGNGPMTESGSAGVLTRPAYGQVMSMAQEHHDTALHDHLLARPPHLQGAHNAGSCPICADRRAAMGIKAVLDAAERDNLDDSDFAYIDSDGNKHLPIHDAAHVRAAMARFNQTQFESAAAKAKAKAKILAKAKTFGIDASGFAGTSEGKKAIAAAEQVLARYTQAVKAGRRTSTSDKQKIQSVIDTLKELLGEEEAEPDESTAMAGKAKVTVAAKTTKADTDGVKAAYTEWATEHQAALHAAG